MSVELKIAKTHESCSGKSTEEWEKWFDNNDNLKEIAKETYKNARSSVPSENH